MLEARIGAEGGETGRGVDCGEVTETEFEGFLERRYGLILVAFGGVGLGQPILGTAV